MEEYEGEEPYCPYCKKSLSWDQFKEIWVCKSHGKFGDSQVIHDIKELKRKIYKFMYVFSCDEDEDPKQVLNQELY
jgi:ribosomal protein L37AE/L43A